MNFLKDKKKSNWSLVYLLTGGSILFFVVITWMYGFDEETIRMNIRWSARFSILCFCIAFSASAFNLMVRHQVTQWISSNRKYFGVSFSIIHLIHLLFLVLLHLNFYQVFVHRSPVDIALGGLAYLFLTLMLITSFDTFSRRISKLNWKRLHTIGGYWILIVFSNSILGRVVGGKLEYLPLALVVISVWVIRLLAWNRRRRQGVILT